MNSSLLTALLAIVAVAVVALLMRSAHSRDAVIPPASPSAGGDEAENPRDEDADETDQDETAAAAVTSDGIAFIGEAHGVRLVPLGEGVPQPSAMAPTIGERLGAGDFTAARLARGAPGVDPWRLELLGRDGEFMLFAFETEEAAACALALLESRGVLRRVLDDDGRPVPPSREEFEEARRRHEETERELAMMLDEDPPKDSN